MAGGAPPTKNGWADDVSDHPDEFTERRNCTVFALNRKSLLFAVSSHRDLLVDVILEMPQLPSNFGID